MLVNVDRAPSAPAPPPRPSVEYFTIQLAALEGGQIGVSLQATTFDEQDCELLNQDLGTSLVSTIDEALRFIRAGVAFN
jgi:hypothetical protein